MLNINMEFIKGVLFIRIIGDLVKKTKNKFDIDINNIITNTGITNIVLNMDGLNYIDSDGIQSLKNLNSNLLVRNGALVICNINKDFINEYDFIVSNNEFTALNKFIF